MPDPVEVVRRWRLHLDCQHEAWFVTACTGLIEIRAFFPENTPLSADVDTLGLLGSFFVLSIRTFPTSSSIAVATEESISSPTQLRVENSGPEVLTGLTVESLFAIPSDKAILEVVGPTSLFVVVIVPSRSDIYVCLIPSMRYDWADWSRSMAMGLSEPRVWIWASPWTHSHQWISM